MLLPSAPLPIEPWRPTTKRERRTWARRGTRGRRGARYVPPVKPLRPVELLADVQAERAHAIDNGQGVAWLYLPESVVVTDAHVRMVKLAGRAAWSR